MFNYSQIENGNSESDNNINDTKEHIKACDNSEFSQRYSQLSLSN